MGGRSSETTNYPKRRRAPGSARAESAASAESAESASSEASETSKPSDATSAFTRAGETAAGRPRGLRAAAATAALRLSEAAPEGLLAKTPRVQRRRDGPGPLTRTRACRWRSRGARWRSRPRSGSNRRRRRARGTRLGTRGRRGRGRDWGRDWGYPERARRGPKRRRPTRDGPFARTPRTGPRDALVAAGEEGPTRRYRSLRRPRSRRVRVRRRPGFEPGGKRRAVDARRGRRRGGAAARVAEKKRRAEPSLGRAKRARGRADARDFVSGEKREPANREERRVGERWVLPRSPS